MTATTEEGWLVEIIFNAVLMPGRPPVTEYLIEAMDWFVSKRAERATVELLADEPQDAFEDWLVRRWLREIRSEAFRDSVQFERLQAQFERGEL